MWEIGLCLRSFYAYRKATQGDLLILEFLHFDSFAASSVAFVRLL